jgi:aryl-alcohol dehydrogenase-like predicted oxidoreductase
VHAFVLGCGGFGGIGSAPDLFGKGESEEEAFAIMDAAWALGLRRFDTADAYGGGRSERAIGAWIRSSGNRPRITTKTFNPMDRGLDHGLSRERVLRQAESSLERLGVDSLDLYLAHAPDPETPVAETFSAFEELVDRGLIGAYGVSNFSAAELAGALAAGRPSLLQSSYSLLDRTDASPDPSNTVVLDLAAQSGIGYQAFSPLAGGWLTGKYRRGEPPPAGSRMTLRPDSYRHLEDEHVYAGLVELAEAAEGRGVSTAALALAWVVSDPRVDSAVVGPRRPEHLEPVREAAALELSAEERERIGSIFPG